MRVARENHKDQVNIACLNPTDHRESKAEEKVLPFEQTDTRMLYRLLLRQVSCHRENMQEKVEFVVDCLSGKQVALKMSDSGFGELRVPDVLVSPPGRSVP